MDNDQPSRQGKGEVADRLGISKASVDMRIPVEQGPGSHQLLHVINMDNFFVRLTDKGYIQKSPEVLHFSDKRIAIECVRTGHDTFSKFIL